MLALSLAWSHVAAEGADVAVASASAAGQLDATNAYRIQRLEHGSSDQRIQVAQDIYGSGLDEPRVYDAIAKLLGDGLNTVTKKDERLDELALYTQALASSGDLAYMPLIDRVIGTGIRYLVRQGREAKETLVETAKTGRPLLTEDKVRMLTEDQAKQCVLIRQATCEANGSADECFEEIRYEVLEAGADSFTILSTINDSGPLGMNSGPWGMFANSTVVSNYYDCRTKPGRDVQGDTAQAAK